LQTEIFLISDVNNRDYIIYYVRFAT